ncbi:MAG: DUF2652 domain-containing protein, partial [Chloroflexi bacterium]|nr:DUF2652 domain-containing protein [Chloroflexota bacterium]
HEGVLLISDISGYTRFLATNELDHSRLIIGELLRALVGATQQPLTVSKLEGDAVFVFAYRDAGLAPGALRDQTLSLLREFARAQVRLSATLGCPCGACTNVTSLGLKFLAHYGRFALLPVGPFTELMGIDVVLVHRLLKNGVPSRNYALFTAALLDRDPELRAMPGLIESVESYEDVGPITVGYLDLTDERERLLHAP